MKKIKLNLEELRVDSFITSQAEAKTGTVKGEGNNTTYTKKERQCESGIIGGNCDTDFQVNCNYTFETCTSPTCVQTCHKTCEPILCVTLPVNC